MLEGVSLGFLDGLGFLGVVALFGLGLATGRLKTRSEVDRLIAVHEKQIELMQNQIKDEQHEKNEWRTECRVKDQTISELSGQNQAMLNAFGPTLTDFLQSLRRAGVGSREERES